MTLQKGTYCYVDSNGKAVEVSTVDLNRSDITFVGEAPIDFPIRKWDFGSNQWVDDIDPQKDALIKTEQEYLNSTDWYIIREVDNGTACPQNIKDARAAARLKINNIKQAANQSELDQLN